MSPSETTLASLRSALAAKRLSASEAAAAALKAMAEAKALNAFITETPERARASAKESDARLSQDRARPLEGIIVSVKDNFCTKDVETTAASRILKGFVPPYESFVSQRVLDAGGVVVGKTNLDEFGMGSSTETSAYGPTLNPFGLKLDLGKRAPGGSSGGAAAAVAANLCQVALATDTGGSIRQPASFCGVVGFKPTYGVCSRWGVIAYASSLDQAGVITKTVEDAAIAMDVIAGHDPKDSTSVAWAHEGFERALGTASTGAKIGIPKEFRDMAINADLGALWTEGERRLRAAGADIHLVDMPTLKYSLPAYYLIALSEASSNLARYDGVRYGVRAPGTHSIEELYETSRARGFGKEVRKRIIVGTFALSAGYYDQYYSKAQRVRRLISDEFSKVLSEVDFLMWPAAPTPAFPLGAHQADPLAMYLEDVFTVPINLAGVPAICLPIFTAANGLPMGMQLIGKRFSDTKLLGVANAVMSAGDR